MPWNGSNGNNIKRIQTKKESGLNIKLISLITVIPLALGGVIYILCLNSGNEVAELAISKQPTSKISINKPKKRPVKSKVSHSPKIEKEKPRIVEQRGMYTNMYGYVMNRPSTAIVITNKTDDAEKPIEERVFKHSSDQKIAGLLLMEPGEMMIGDASSLFGKNFAKSFLRSLKAPIEILPEDDEFTTELKMAVRDTRLELKSRLDAGEDIGALLLDEQKKLQELGLFKAELKSEIEKIARSEDLTEEEMSDFVNAANKMLESRGGTPLSMPRFAARRFQIIKERNNSMQGDK